MWCGTAPRISIEGFSVPMSWARYTIADSMLTLSSGRRGAIVSASSVLPQAVGPVMHAHVGAAG
jgi:hypothetical protein